MDPLPLHPGDRVASRYLLLAALGEGGMAVVFEALDEQLQRRVALKVLRRISDIAAARFEREARAANAIRHPAVVPVFAVGRLADGRPYLALELIDGEPLNELVARVGPLPAERALHLLLPAVGALAEAHAAGIIHRDLKPSNLIVQHAPGQVEQLRLLDFGIAAWDEPDGRRLTKTGEVFGTPEFMAPEQALSRPVTPATDVWAIGAVLYELLSGNLPFQGTSAPSVLFKVVNEAPAPLPPTVPPEVVLLVEACLKKQPTQRPADAGALLQQMEALLLPPRRELASSRPGEAILRSLSTAPVPVAPPASLPAVTPPSSPPVAAPSAPPAAPGVVDPPTQPNLRGRGLVGPLLAIALVVGGSLSVWWALKHESRSAVGTAAGMPSEADEPAEILQGDPEDIPPPPAPPRGAEAPPGPVAGRMPAVPEESPPSGEAPPSEAPPGPVAGRMPAVPEESPASGEAPPSEAPPGPVAGRMPAVPEESPPSGEAPASEAPASEEARLPAVPAAPDPALEAPRALLEKGDSRGALRWLARNPRTGDPADRLHLEIQARLARNDLRSLSKLVQKLLSIDPAAADEALQARLLEALVEQRYWSSLVPALADPRLYPRLHERLLDLSRGPNRTARARAIEVMTRAGQAVTPAVAPRDTAPDPAARVRAIRAALAREKGCYKRKSLIESLGRLGHPSALPLLQAESRRGSFINACMDSAIEDAMAAIRRRK